MRSLFLTMPVALLIAFVVFLIVFAVYEAVRYLQMQKKKPRNGVRPQKKRGFACVLDLQTFAVSGKSAVVKIGAATILGLNDAKITINGDTIDVTNFASGGWIEKIQ